MRMMVRPVMESSTCKSVEDGGGDAGVATRRGGDDVAGFSRDVLIPSFSGDAGDGLPLLLWRRVVAVDGEKDPVASRLDLWRTLALRKRKTAVVKLDSPVEQTPAGGRRW
nr:hypothetical protein Iba_chr11bCG13280 [Ipomoea batatas]